MIFIPSDQWVHPLLVRFWLRDSGLCWVPQSLPQEELIRETGVEKRNASVPTQRLYKHPQGLCVCPKGVISSKWIESGHTGWIVMQDRDLFFFFFLFAIPQRFGPVGNCFSTIWQRDWLVLPGRFEAANVGGFEGDQFYIYHWSRCFLLQLLSGCAGILSRMETGWTWQ